MASAFSHALVGAAVGMLAGQALRPTERLANGLPWLCAAAAVLPDADVLMHAFVDYSNILGHRGAFHAFGFYVLLSGVLAGLRVFRGNAKPVAAALFCALASHSLMDMLTDGGLGVALFWPLSDERYFFPWRPIPVSPLSVPAFFSARGLRILSHELPFALPGFLLVWLMTRGAKQDEDHRRPPLDSAPDDPGGDDELAVLEISDSIDLHHFAPRDVRSVVESYLEAAWEKGLPEVRLIHGRGKGVQRARVQKLLSAHPLVEAYRDAPAARGGWGATIAWLKPRTTAPPR